MLSYNDSLHHKPVIQSILCIDINSSISTVCIHL